MATKPVDTSHTRCVLSAIVYDEPAITVSPLSHILRLDGVTIAVRIYCFPRVRAYWMTEVIDQVGGLATVDAVYPSDRAALRGVHAIIEAAGIRSLTGSAATFH